jgi:hypothetical protein
LGAKNNQFSNTFIFILKIYFAMDGQESEFGEYTLDDFILALNMTVEPELVLPLFDAMTHMALKNLAQRVDSSVITDICEEELFSADFDQGFSCVINSYCLVSVGKLVYLSMPQKVYANSAEQISFTDAVIFTGANSYAVKRAFNSFIDEALRTASSDAALHYVGEKLSQAKTLIPSDVLEVYTPAMFFAEEVAMVDDLLILERLDTPIPTNSNATTEPLAILNPDSTVSISQPYRL